MGGSSEGRDFKYVPVNGEYAYMEVSGTKKLKRGDTIYTQVQTSVVTSPQILAGQGYTSFVINKTNTGSETIAPTASIEVYAAGNGSTILDANTDDIDFVEVSDTHGAWNGTQFTPPAAGRYRFAGKMGSSATYGGNIRVYRGGSVREYVGLGLTKTITPFYFEYDLDKGETVSFRPDTPVTLSNSTNVHYLSITRVK